MQSKTSFFNKTVFKKNLTRFAPVMVLYTLCLLLGMAMMYMDGRNSYTLVNFWFAHYMGQCIQVMGVVNLFFAPIMAMLLFGDLYNSRMCNALHAMPLRRESWFATNLISGLMFSLIPTAIMALLSIPLLNGTVVHNAWQIGILWFIATNLEFICFFGIAVFSVFCTGSRFAMGLVYAALNGGAFVIYYLVNTIYTPMLYGVITPTQLLLRLTPVAVMTDNVFVEVQSYNELEKLFFGREGEMVANFWVNECYYDLIVYAIAGIVFLALALVLYRKRKLECAGDAVAFQILEPVFQVACALGGFGLAAICLDMFFGYAFRGNAVFLYVFLACGLIVGWFAGRMLIARSIQVFGLKNWKGLGILIAVLAVTVGLTYFDVLDIEDWTPRAEKVSTVTIGNGAYNSIELTEQEDIEQIIRLQEMALEDRQEDTGAFPLSYVESLGAFPGRVDIPERDGFYYGEDGYDEQEPHLYASQIYITYKMNSGREVQRKYAIWASLEEGDIVKEYLSRWEVVWEYARMGWYDEFDMDRVFRINVNGEEISKEQVTKETVESLFAAIQADCEARTMTQNYYYHDGWFEIFQEKYQEYVYTKSIAVSVYSYIGNGERDFDYTCVDFDVYTDSENTLAWLEEHNLLKDGVLSVYTLG